MLCIEMSDVMCVTCADDHACMMPLINWIGSRADVATANVLFIRTQTLFCAFADGWTTADLVFLWKEGDPVQVVKNLHLPRFTLEKFLTDYCNSKTNTGKSWANHFFTLYYT